MEDLRCREARVSAAVGLKRLLDCDDCAGHDIVTARIACLMAFGIFERYPSCIGCIALRRMALIFEVLA